MKRVTAGIAIAVVVGLAAAVSQASIDRAATPPHHPTLPLCEVEDGSSGPLPCRWDAGTEGNGIGRSFTVTLTRDGHRKFTYDDGTEVVDNG